MGLGSNNVRKKCEVLIIDSSPQCTGRAQAPFQGPLDRSFHIASGIMRDVFSLDKILSPSAEEYKS